MFEEKRDRVNGDNRKEGREVEASKRGERESGGDQILDKAPGRWHDKNSEICCGCCG